MITAVNSWILRLTGAALISAAALTLAPEGAAKRVVRLVCGLVSVAALLSVGAELDFASYAAGMEEYRSEASALVSDALDSAESSKRAIIEERAAAYILDKAEKLGAHLTSARVTAEWSEAGCWYPHSVKLEGETTETQRRELTQYIEAELGVPLGRQEWEKDER